MINHKERCHNTLHTIFIAIFLFIFTAITNTLSASETNKRHVDVSECKSLAGTGNIVIAPDDKTVLTGWDDGQVRLWDINTGKVIHDFLPKSDKPRAYYANFAFAPQKDIIAIGTNTEVTLWDVETKNKLNTFQREIDDTFGTEVSFSSDGQRLFSSGYDGASLWDVKTGKLIYRFLGQQAREIDQYGYMSSDDKYVLTTESDSVNLWSTITGEKIHIFDGALYGRFTPDAKFILTRNYNMLGQRVKLILSDINTFQEKRTFETYSDWLKFSSDGRYFLESANPVRLWEIATGKILLKISYGFVIDFFSDNHHILLPYSATNDSFGRDNTLQIWDADIRKSTQQIHIREEEIFNYQLTHDGKYLLIADHNGELYLWSIESGKQIRQFC